MIANKWSCDVGKNKPKRISTDHIDESLVFRRRSRHRAFAMSIVSSLGKRKTGLARLKIAKLTWDMVADPAGPNGTVLELHDRAAKKKRAAAGRSRLHSDLRKCYCHEAIAPGHGVVSL